MTGGTTPATAGQPPTPEAIMQLGMGYWASKTLLSAIELRVFTVLAETPDLDSDALREKLGLHARGATDFFDALVALGMLEREDGRHRNTQDTGLFLDRAKPTYVGGMLEMSNARLYGFWGSLTEGLRTGEVQNEANMLIETTGGFDYAGADCRGWMKEAGFRDTRVEHLGGPDSMVVGIK